MQFHLHKALQNQQTKEIKPKIREKTQDFEA